MRTERPEVLETVPDELSGDGWRSRATPRQRGFLVLRLAVVLGIVAAGAWAFYANLAAGRPAMDMNMRATNGGTPYPVTLGPVERGAVRGTVVYTGSVAPYSEEDIYPRVMGRIVDMPVYPGDAVRAGQLVARLDDVELSSRVHEAEALAATTQANRAQMEADRVAAHHGIVQMEKELAMVEAELGYARGVAARSERLAGVGAISGQEYENDRSMAASLEAKREAARSRLDQARAMELSARKRLEAADSMVTQNRAAVRTATVVRDYVNILAPSSGYVAKRLVAPGVLVQPGMAILKITRIERVRVQANVGEKDLPLIKVGSPVTIMTTASGQPPVTARVTAVFPFVDQGARTAVVEAIVDNPDRRFLPGQYVQMQFVTGERAGALTVPRSAVVRLGGNAKVWVVQGDRTEPRDVATGLEGPERVEIVQGLTGEEQVVARGHEGLYAGARIAPVTGSAPVPKAATPPPDTRGMPQKPTQPKEGPHAGH